MSPGLLLLLLTLGTPVGQAGDPTGSSQVDIRQQRYLGVDQLMKILELSPRPYSVQNTEQLLGQDLVSKMYAQRVAPIEHPFRGPDGLAPVAPFGVEKAAAKMIRAGQRHLAAGRQAKARAAFEAALAIQPNAYPAMLGLGRIALRNNQPAEALGLLQQAKVHNPDDPLTHRLLGDAAAARHLPAQARSHYVQALIRRPRDPETLAGLARLGIAPPADLFRPRAAARKHGGRIDIYADYGVAASRIWLAWAAARAAWLGEPGLRVRYGGSAERPDWSTQQELFCLACLLGNYLQARRAKKAAVQPDLERLLAIQKRHLLDEYVIYAIGSRLDPNAPLMLPAEQRKRMQAFVDLFVVPPLPEDAP